MRGSLPQHEFRVVIPIVAGVGNALMAVPMVRQLKSAFPSARITIIARIGAMGEVFRRLSEVDEVLVTGNGLAGVVRTLWWTRRRRPDVYLVPFPSNRWQYNLLAALSGAPIRILNRYPVGRWRALGVVRAERVEAVRGIHDVQQNLRLLSPLGVEPAPVEPPCFPVTDADRQRAQQLLAQVAVHEHAAFIAVHAGSGRTLLALAKRWPPHKYAELIAAFGRQFSHQVVLLEGPDEAGVGEEILRACREHNRGAPMPGVSAVRLNGPLGEAAALLERARLYVGSDSGLAHLAAAVGTRPVTIFAPADPDRVCPFGYRDLVVRPGKDCSPCFTYPWQTPYPKMRCREPMCINEVTVDAVLDAVHRAMAPLPVLVA